MSNHKPISADYPTGIELLHEPSLNKGTAFTAAERDALGLRGLLPPRTFSQAQRAQHVMNNIRRKPNNLEKYLYLIGLQDRNEKLFYRVLIDNMAELSPIVYTPTVGLACQEYSRIFRRPRGMFISKYERDRIKEILRNWPYRDVRVILASEASRVTDEMFAAAAKALDVQVTGEDFLLGRIYPSLSRIREVSLNIALAVARVAYAMGLAAMPEPADLIGHIKSQMYDPTYREYV